VTLIDFLYPCHCFLSYANSLAYSRSIVMTLVAMMMCEVLVLSVGGVAQLLLLHLVELTEHHH